MNSWENLKHFKADDKRHAWGDPSKLDFFLLLFLDEFRDAVKTPLFVTSGFRPKDKGQHGEGRAVDIVAPEWNKPLFDLYLFAERFGFGGIGVYRDWFYAGERLGGLHLDTRITVGSYASSLMSARWACVRPGLNKLSNLEAAQKIPQVYLPMDSATLKKEGFI